jgi:hypothetical protein
VFRSKISYDLLKDTKCYTNSIEGFFPCLTAAVAMTSVFTSITHVIRNRNCNCSILHCKCSASNILTDSVPYILTPAILNAHVKKYLLVKNYETNSQFHVIAVYILPNLKKKLGYNCFFLFFFQSSGFLSFFTPPPPSFRRNASLNSFISKCGRPTH